MRIRALIPEQSPLFRGERYRPTWLRTSVGVRLFSCREPFEDSVSTPMQALNGELLKACILLFEAGLLEVVWAFTMKLSRPCRNGRDARCNVRGGPPQHLVHPNGRR